MKSILKSFYTTLAIIFIVSAFVPVIPPEILPRNVVNEIANKVIKTAEAAAPYPPSFRVNVKDHHCTDQGVNNSGYIGEEPGSSPSSATTDDNAKDPDCGRIEMYLSSQVNSIPQSQTIYNRDFRLGVGLAESENGCTAQAGAIQWTPWVSDGGGFSWGARAGSNVNDPDCLRIFYESRPLPSGVLIKDIRVGLSTGNGAFQWTPWARQGGGWSGYSGGGNISPGQLDLDVQLVDVYDAQYVSDTVPSDMQRDQSGNYNIVMKNKGAVWNTDVYTPSPDTCPPPVPQNRGETCIESGTSNSSLIKLKRVDGDGSVSLINPTNTSPLNYSVDTTKNYIATDVCLGWGVAMNSSQSKFALTDLLKVKTAYANRLPSDTDPGPGDPGPICNQWGLQYTLDSQAPTNTNIVYDNNGTFPLSLRISPSAAYGTHTMQFQMVQLAANGTEIGTFGSLVNIDIEVSNGPTLNCTASQNANQSTNPSASTLFSIYMSGLPGGYNNTVTTTLASQRNGIVANPPSAALTPVKRLH
jgi:hypothetical protein